MKCDKEELEYLKSVLSYNEVTGEFVWIGAKRSDFNGKVAGTIGQRGYVHIHIGSKVYKGHRLAWLFCYGVWPTHGIDHISGIKHDNRIVNLRDIPQRDNNCNTPRHRDGKTPGWQFREGCDRPYHARIGINGKTYSLGTYATEAEAQEAYNNACNNLDVVVNKKTKKELRLEAGIPTGVSFSKKSNRWIFNRRIDGKQKQIASANTLDEIIEKVNQYNAQ